MGNLFCAAAPINQFIQQRWNGEDRYDLDGVLEESKEAIVHCNAEEFYRFEAYGVDGLLNEFLTDPKKQQVKGQHRIVIKKVLQRNSPDAQSPDRLAVVLNHRKRRQHRIDD
jgi:hypothetical protein